MTTESHNTKVRGQTPVLLVVATALLTTSGNWLMTRVFNSPETLQAQISVHTSDINVLKKSDENQDKIIKTVADDVEYIRRSIEEQNRRQSITINDVAPKR